MPLPRHADVKAKALELQGLLRIVESFAGGPTFLTRFGRRVVKWCLKEPGGNALPASHKSAAGPPSLPSSTPHLAPRVPSTTELVRRRAQHCTPLSKQNPQIHLHQLTQSPAQPPPSPPTTHQQPQRKKTPPKPLPHPPPPRRADNPTPQDSNPQFRRHMASPARGGEDATSHA